MKISIHHGDQIIGTFDTARLTSRSRRGAFDGRVLQRDAQPICTITRMGPVLVGSEKRPAEPDARTSDNKDEREVGPNGRPPRTPAEMNQYNRKFYGN